MLLGLAWPYLVLLGAIWPPGRASRARLAVIARSEATRRSRASAAFLRPLDRFALARREKGVFDALRLAMSAKQGREARLGSQIAPSKA